MEAGCCQAHSDSMELSFFVEVRWLLQQFQAGEWKLAGYDGPWDGVDVRLFRFQVNSQEFHYFWSFLKYEKSTKTYVFFWGGAGGEVKIISCPFVSPEKCLESQTFQTLAIGIISESIVSPVKEQLDALKDGTMSSNQRLREMEVSFPFFGGDKR